MSEQTDADRIYELEETLDAVAEERDALRLQVEEQAKSIRAWREQALGNPTASQQPDYHPIGWAVVGPRGKFHSGHCTKEGAERRQKSRQQHAAEKGLRDVRSYVVPIYSTFTGEAE